MLLRVGYDVQYDCPAPTPMIVLLTIHHSLTDALRQPDRLATDPPVPITPYRDGFGNWCSRLVAPPGTMRLTTDATLRLPRVPDERPPPDTPLTPVQDLPPETLVYLLGSRYCETDRLSQAAWDTFGHLPLTWARVEAVNDWVHNHITFGYHFARPTKTAFEAFTERTGVCRDFAHLGVALCRALNVPARYCTGYLGDIDIPPPAGPMDFAGWFEVFVGGRWYTVDPRNRVPRVGRALIAQGRDAADVPLTHIFGPAGLRSFRVWTDEVPEDLA
ncbi:transglutaminase family protein [Caenispirillum salinarum]|uniref:transglutaminase-like domain-containing protein n=1 Tax=Caenispirillum salinarum TaxID=859058 RepID=UPI00384DFF25